jgi:hypothetical protein
MTSFRFEVFARDSKPHVSSADKDKNKFQFWNSIFFEKAATSVNCYSNAEILCANNLPKSFKLIFLFPEFSPLIHSNCMWSTISAIQTWPVRRGNENKSKVRDPYTRRASWYIEGPALFLRIANSCVHRLNRLILHPNSSERSSRCCFLDQLHQRGLPRWRIASADVSECCVRISFRIAFFRSRKWLTIEWRQEIKIAKPQKVLSHRW